MLLCLLIAASPDAFALVVTNNKSLESSRPELRYADDDGIAYASLFDERLGRANVFLHTELDVDSSRLYPGWSERARPPKREDVHASVKAIAAKLSADSEVYVVFAGHGDTDRGRGFLELQDGRFYAEELEALVTELGRARRIHVVLDSCNSYFMLNPRKSGGTRFTAAPEARASFLDRHPNVGAIISTSAEAETYEWSEVQSGIFSYVLRSGLRGAADANGDGRLTYEELDAFAAVATRPIVNELYRPRIFARAPAGDRAVVFHALPNDPTQTRIVKKKGRAERISVRDHQGVRVVDMNADADTELVIALPKDAEEFDVVAVGTPRRSARLARGGRLVLDEAAFAETSVASRGEARVFGALFSEPFGASEVQAHVPVSETESAFGISAAKEERFRLMLHTFSDYGEGQRRKSAISFFAGSSVAGLAGLSLVTAGGVLYGRGNAVEGGPYMIVGAVSVGASLGVLIPGLVLWRRHSAEEKLYDEHMAQNRSTPEARARAVANTERLLFERVQQLKKDRMRMSTLSLVVGSVAMVFGGVYLGLAMSPSVGRYLGGVSSTTASGLLLGLGAGNLLFGIVGRTDYGKGPIERMWDLYSASESDGAASAPASQAASLEWSVAPFVAPGDRGGVNAGLSGGLRF